MSEIQAYTNEMSSLAQEELERAITGITEKEPDEPAETLSINYSSAEAMNVDDERQEMNTQYQCNLSESQPNLSEPNLSEPNLPEPNFNNEDVDEQSLNMSAELGKLAASMPLPPTMIYDPHCQDQLAESSSGSEQQYVGANADAVRPMWSNGQPVMSTHPPCITSTTHGSQQQQLLVDITGGFVQSSRERGGVSGGRGRTARRRRSGSRILRGGHSVGSYSFMENLMNDDGFPQQLLMHAPSQRIPPGLLYGNAPNSGAKERSAEATTSDIPAAVNNEIEPDFVNEESRFATPQLLPKRLRSRRTTYADNNNNKNNDDEAGTEEADDIVLNERMDAYIEKFSEISRGDHDRLESKFNVVDLSRRPTNLQEAIAMYIDNLVTENERRTRISECHVVPSLPLNFQKEEYYREVMCRPVSFPTHKFRNWLKLYNVDIEITDPEGHTASETLFPPSLAVAPTAETKSKDDGPGSLPKLPRQLPVMTTPTRRPMISRRKRGKVKGRGIDIAHVPVQPQPYYVYSPAADAYSRRTNHIPSETSPRHVSYNDYSGIDVHHYAPPGVMPYGSGGGRGYTIHHAPQQSREEYPCYPQPQPTYQPNYQPLPYQGSRFPSYSMPIDPYSSYPYQSCIPRMYAPSYAYPGGGGPGVYGYHPIGAPPGPEYLMYDRSGQSYFPFAESKIEQGCNDSNDHLGEGTSSRYVPYSVRPNCNVYHDIDTEMIATRIKVDMSEEDPQESAAELQNNNYEGAPLWGCSKLEQTDSDWGECHGQMSSDGGQGTNSFTLDVNQRANSVYQTMRYQNCPDENNNARLAPSSYDNPVYNDLDRQNLGRVERPMFGYGAEQPVLDNNMHEQQPLRCNNTEQEMIGNNLEQPVLDRNGEQLNLRCNTEQLISDQGTEREMYRDDNIMSQQMNGEHVDQQPIVRNEILQSIYDNNVQRPIFLCNLEQPIANKNFEQSILGNGVEQPSILNNVEQLQMFRNPDGQLVPVDIHDKPCFVGNIAQPSTKVRERLVWSTIEPTDISSNESQFTCANEQSNLVRVPESVSTQNDRMAFCGENDTGVNDSYRRIERIPQNEDEYSFDTLDLVTYPVCNSDSSVCDMRMNTGELYTIQSDDGANVSEGRYSYSESDGTRGINLNPGGVDTERNWRSYDATTEIEEESEQGREATCFSESNELRNSDMYDTRDSQCNNSNVNVLDSQYDSNVDAQYSRYDSNDISQDSQYNNSNNNAQDNQFDSNANARDSQYDSNANTQDSQYDSNANAQDNKYNSNANAQDSQRDSNANAQDSQRNSNVNVQDNQFDSNTKAQDSQNNSTTVDTIDSAHLKESIFTNDALGAGETTERECDPVSLVGQVEDVNPVTNDEINCTSEKDKGTLFDGNSIELKQTKVYDELGRGRDLVFTDDVQDAGEGETNSFDILHAIEINCDADVSATDIGIIAQSSSNDGVIDKIVKSVDCLVDKDKNVTPVDLDVEAPNLADESVKGSDNV